MLPPVTLRNIAILGLTQTGIVVLGVLATGVVFKWREVASAPHTDGTKLVVEFGHFALVIPLLWVTAAMAVRARNQEADATEFVTFLTGLLLAAGLLVVVFFTSVTPFLRLFGWCGGCSLSLAE